jgi:Zn-finger nucleic acid-binding protein
MFCPVCKSVELILTERQGIEIDYCPTCRGVWLDRGELDKLIERSVQVVTSVHTPDTSRGHDSRHNFKDSNFGHKDHDCGQQRQQGQRRSFLRDLFD